MKDAEKREEVGRRFRFDTFEWRGLEEYQVRRVSGCSTVLKTYQRMGCVKSMLPIRGGPSLIGMVPAGSRCSLNGHSEGKSWSLWQLRDEFRKVHWSPYSLQQDSGWHVSKASTVLLWDQSSCHFQKCSSHWSFSQTVYYLYPVNHSTCTLSLKISREEQTSIHLFHLWIWQENKGGGGRVAL